MRPTGAGNQPLLGQPRHESAHGGLGNAPAARGHGSATAADGAHGVMVELLAQLDAHEARDPAEQWSLTRTRRLVRWLPAPLDEVADPTHVTGSAIVLAQAGRVLLHRHKRLGRWLQPGGHVEPGEAPWDAAVRETQEETGLDAVHPADGPRLIHVDVHEGPRGHVHLDLRYRLHGDGAAPLMAEPGAAPGVDWWSPAEVRDLSDRSTVAAVVAAVQPFAPAS